MRHVKMERWGTKKFSTQTYIFLSMCVCVCIYFKRYTKIVIRHNVDIRHVIFVFFQQ